MKAVVIIGIPGSPSPVKLTTRRVARSIIPSVLSIKSVTATRDSRQK